MWYIMSIITRDWPQLRNFAQPRQRLWARLKQRHHEVGLLFAVCLGVQHAIPVWPGDQMNRCKVINF